MTTQPIKRDKIAGKKKPGIGGRKKLAPGAVRNRQINFRVSEKEREQILQWFADSSCRTLGEFCYRVIRDAKVIRYEKVTLSKELELEIKRIGNNINQIAHHLNLRKDQKIAIDSYMEMQNIAQYLKALLSK